MLAEEAALHLLPPLKDLPPAMQSRFSGSNKPPMEVVECYRDLLAKNQLKKAREENSLVWDLAEMWAGNR